LVVEIVLTAILVSIILNTATRHRSFGHNDAIAVGSTVALLGADDPPYRWRQRDQVQVGPRQATTEAHQAPGHAT
jgi:hypothetical protein